MLLCVAGVVFSPLYLQVTVYRPAGAMVNVVKTGQFRAQCPVVPEGSLTIKFTDAYAQMRLFVHASSSHHSPVSPSNSEQRTKFMWVLNQLIKQSKAETDFVSTHVIPVTHTLTGMLPPPPPPPPSSSSSAPTTTTTTTSSTTSSTTTTTVPTGIAPEVVRMVEDVHDSILNTIRKGAYLGIEAECRGML